MEVRRAAIYLSLSFPLSCGGERRSIFYFVFVCSEETKGIMWRALSSSRLARRRRAIGLCHTLVRVNTV
jgi:hypothetical protein